ncbi:uncharacterized protein TRUGW13939_06694 [Talaromyces rugulosus]|uniref:Uncharacterized protein n=1 Tax=Talaromyces rugulosus TaxID=121627 RepID=A0A7H8R0S2_TALRU|nr:uncharacterized protein TRUGW13939_06694 [Talaromyces rugulosus]QKX59558.1 hypothetical protein TRUGW13939_06694 [Talaromyces rugulosus]
MASSANEAIQQLELLLQPEETIDNRTFGPKVGAALNGKLGAFYQLYLFAITFVHTTRLIPQMVSLQEFAAAFRNEALSILRRTEQRLPITSYGIQTSRFSIPTRRESIDYMLDVLHNVEHLTTLFPAHESFYDPNTHQEVRLLERNNNFIGMQGEPRVVLTLFRTLLAAELLEKHYPGKHAQNDSIMDEVVRWWWVEGEFPENFPNFDARLAAVKDEYPGVFGKLLRRLGNTDPVEDPRSWEDPRMIFPYLPRQSQTQPWTSKVGDLPIFSFLRRGPSAIGDLRRIISEATGIIAEDPQVPTEQNPPRSTNTYSLPDFSTTSEPSQEDETKKPVPVEKEEAPAADGGAPPSRSTNTYSLPDFSTTSESSQEAKEKKTAPTETEASTATTSISTNTYSLSDFLSTSKSSQENESGNLAPAAKKVPVAAAPRRSTNTFSVPEKHIESSDSSDSADDYVHYPTVSSARETTATDAVPTSTSNVSPARETTTIDVVSTSTSNISPAIEEAPVYPAMEMTATEVVPTSTSNVSPAIEEPLVSPNKDSTVPSPPHALHNTSDEPIHSPSKDTAISDIHGSEGSLSPSRQLHEFAQELPQDIPANSPPASQEPPPHATEKEQEAKGTSSPSPDLREVSRLEEEISVAGTPDTPDPQMTSAATGSEQALEQLPAVPPKTSPPPPPRRSVRQRRQPERYDSAPARRRGVIKRESEDKGKTTKSTTKSPNKRKRQDKHKNEDLERGAPAKRQKHSGKGKGALRKKPAPLRPSAGVSALETVGVSARGRMRKAPQKYGR